MNWKLVLAIIIILFSLFAIYDSYKSYKKDKEPLLVNFSLFESSIALLILGLLLLIFGC